MRLSILRRKGVRRLLSRLERRTCTRLITHSFSQVPSLFFRWHLGLSFQDGNHCLRRCILRHRQARGCRRILIQCCKWTLRLRQFCRRQRRQAVQFCRLLDGRLTDRLLWFLFRRFLLSLLVSQGLRLHNRFCCIWCHLRIIHPGQ